MFSADCFTLDELFLEIPADLSISTAALASPGKGRPDCETTLQVSAPQPNNTIDECHPIVGGPVPLGGETEPPPDVGGLGVSFLHPGQVSGCGLGSSG